MLRLTKASSTSYASFATQSYYSRKYEHFLKITARMPKEVRQFPCVFYLQYL
jgi:hypothetical protein